MALLPKSAAYTRMFLMVQSSDHITALTGASPTVNISKAGAAFGAAAGTVNEVANGWYKVALTSADTGTAGDLAYHITAASGDNTDFVDQVGMDGSDSVHGGMTALPNAAAGAAGGLWILGANAAATTTLTGLAASGATPATEALTLSGGAASTTGGGTAARGLTVTGGPGAASTNGAAIGALIQGGGTNTVASTASGLKLAGTSTGHGLDCESGTGATGNGLNATSNASNGNGIAGAGVGTGDGLAITAGTTGRGLHAIGGATSGSGIRSEGTAGNAIAMELVGQGSATALSCTGGATGAGAKFIGGGTSGDGIDITTTSGDGLSILPTAGNGIVSTANGTSKHGIVSTGGTGGTSDGVKCAAGTGGVDLRANITGNLTGTVTTVTTVTNQLTAAAIATGVWTDTTAGDFTVSASVGKSLMNGVSLGTGLTIVSVSGSVGSVTGAVGSVTGAVGSVTGAVGSVTGSVGSVTAAVTLSAGDSPVLQSGTATAGGASTITIQTALGHDTLPVGCLIKITSGTGTKQCRTITSYVDSTQVVTVDRAWTTAPDATSVYSILFDEATALGASLKISGVVLTDTTTAVTNGVTLAASQHVIVDSGTVTTVTNQLTAAAIATGIWQDATAGDFTAANSIGKSIMNGVSLGTGLTVARVTLVDTLTTYTGNTPQTGDAYARIGANGVSLSAIPDEAGVTTLLARLTATRGGYLDNLSGGAVALASGVPCSDKTGFSLTQAFPTNFASTSITAGGAVTVDGTSPLTESYSANAGAMTLAQALYEIAQNIGEFAISGTTITVKKRDHSTTAEQYTLDDPTSPTSRTRAS